MDHSTAPTRSAEVIDGWTVEHRDGTAASLHDPRLVVGDRRRILVNHVTRPALVLGSAQAAGDVDAGRLAARGIDLARRRSGGGAVLLVPEEHVWVDAILPIGDPLWSDDVTVASRWVGEWWARALVAAGVSGVEVRRSGVTNRGLAASACFAGVGPGEVSVGGRKLVGLSQRRTRQWAWFQCVVHRRWNPAATVELLSPRRTAPGWGDSAAAGLDAALREGVTSLADAPGAEWDVVSGLLASLA